MDAAFSLQLLIEKGVDHPVPCRLHFRREGFRGDDKPEMRFLGHTVFHSLVVSMLTRIVVDL